MPNHRLYHDLAHLWPLLSPPSDYQNEADHALALFDAWFDSPEQLTLLDLGAGGGHLALHLHQAGHTVTAVDLAEPMLEQCRALVPGIETVRDDMRTARLTTPENQPRTFDAVLLTDAIDYMTTPDDAAAAVHTVAHHLRPGGLALIAPTYTRETFVSGSTESDTAPQAARGLASDATPTQPHLFSYVYDLDPQD
ncbi:MAG: class I SAM-dependent methyltransferase, partial [Planctomycetota bacterium]